MALTDAQVAQAQFIGVVSEVMILTSLAYARGWFKINDNQTPSWATISNSQTPTWTTVNDNQSAGWTQIDNGQG